MYQLSITPLFSTTIYATRSTYKDAIERQKYRAIERRDLQMFAGIASGEGGDFYP